MSCILYHEVHLLDNTLIINVASLTTHPANNPWVATTLSMLPQQSQNIRAVED